MSVVALPDPQTLAAGQVPALVSRVAALRVDLRKHNDVAGADDLRRKLAAYERYVADKGARTAIEAESRRTEVLIGQLLGEPSDVGGRGKTVASGNGLTKKERHVFRELGSHDAIVEQSLSVGTTQRAKILVAIQRAKLAEKSSDVEGENDIHHGHFREALAHIPDNTVDLIFTDPPYAKEFIPLYGELAEFGARVLKPGGSLMAYCGQYALPQILVDMDETLRYWWTCACVHDGGNHKSLPGIRAYVIWKPIVWFVKDTNASTEFVLDAILRPAPDKKVHDWQQSVAEPLHYIEKLTPAGGLVVDPFTGGGTTKVAADTLGRRFIGSDIDLDAIKRANGRIAA